MCAILSVVYIRIDVIEKVGEVDATHEKPDYLTHQETDKRAIFIAY